MSEGALSHLREHRELIDGDLAFLQTSLRSGRRVLDIGAGRGDFVAEARRRGFDACAVEMLPEATVVWQRAGVAGIVGDGFRLPFRPHTFDAVRMKEVLEHVQDPLALVREADRVLKPDGYLIAHVPTPYSQFYPVGNFWDDYTHVRPISRYGLQRLIADAGMQLEDIYGYSSGRSPVERVLMNALARVLPHQYHVVARPARQRQP